MENKQHLIRYCIVNGSIWYSINDINEYLKEKKAITNDLNLSYFFSEYLAKKNIKSDAHYNYYQTICIEPFDEFYNWVVFDNIYNFCKKSDKEKIKSTNLLQCIDLNNLHLIEETYPSIHKILKEVKFTQNEPYRKTNPNPST